MDLRNSKGNMLLLINKLEAKLEKVFEAGESGILYVGAANYADREAEALYNLREAMRGKLG